MAIHMWRRYEFTLFILAALISLLPLLVVEYIPSGDGPEHLLTTVIVDELAKAPMQHFELNSEAAATQIAIPLIAALGSVLELGTSLKWFTIFLVLGLAYAVRFAIQSRPPMNHLVFLIPFLLMDVSLYKGFLNFYLGLTFLFFSYGLAIRQLATRGMIALAMTAVLSLLSHPLVFVLNCYVILIEAVRRRDIKWCGRMARAYAPAVAIAIGILYSLSANSAAGPIKPLYFFNPAIKLQRFFIEGWKTLSSVQMVAPAIVTGMCFLGWGLSQKRTPKAILLSLSLLLLYWICPEGLPDWSWISIRLPLVVVLFLVIEVSQMEIHHRKLWNYVQLIGLVCCVAGSILVARTSQELDRAVSDFVELSDNIPENSIMTPIVPVSFPNVGRVNVLTHASAYIALEKFTPFPGIFAVDKRVHQYLLKPASKTQLFGSDQKLSWHQFVNPEIRIKWFCKQSSGVAVTFGLNSEHTKMLVDCSKRLQTNGQAVAWQRPKPMASPK